MSDKLIPIDLPPGVLRNGTRYQAKGRWYDSHLVRWYDGTIRPVGGWGAVRTSAGVVVDLVGFPRAALAWMRSDGAAWIAAGTTGTATSKLYVLSAGVLTDVTPAGLTDGVVDGGYASGAGKFGRGPYGYGLFGSGSTAQKLVDADTWSLDNFGDVMLSTLTSDGRLFRQSGTAQATVVANAPTGIRAVVVTPERFIMALGNASDPRSVAWASQETETTWAPADGNSAGAQPLMTNGRLVAGRRTSRETLIWTNTDVHAATYIGGDFVYSFEQRGDACGLAGPNAVAVVGPKAYWMSEKNFFVYDGVVRTIHSEVSNFVFPSLNASQRAKVFAIALPEFSEVWWFYPSISGGGLENSRYVAYNYDGNFWMIGSLARAAGVSSGATPNPVMLDTVGLMYEHEVGGDRGDEVPYLDSGPIEIADGDQFMDAQRLIPDEQTLGDVNATFYVANYPTDTEIVFGPYSLATPTDVRFQARQARVKLSQNVETDWRVGVFRLGVVPGDRR